ncbi:hypothetical protein CL689_04430 [Candidatus Saccharibacteria bacterium]|nr:hypothetical protein [Candidatus Saccharibacteria bacterium]
MWTFASSSEAQELMVKIVESVGLRPNFAIRAADVDNAQADIDQNGRRLILYSEVWVQRMLAKSGNYWAGVGLLAHECAHHLNGDTLLGTGSHPQIELAADQFAGSTIARLGGCLKDALSLFEMLPEAGSPTHPPRRARLEAATVGWRSASQSGRECGESPRPDFNMLGEWRLTYADDRACTYTGSLYVQKRTGDSTYSGYQRHRMECSGTIVQQNAAIIVDRANYRIEIRYSNPRSNPPTHYDADRYSLRFDDDGGIIRGRNADAAGNGRNVTLTRVK